MTFKVTKLAAQIGVVYETISVVLVDPKDVPHAGEQEGGFLVYQRDWAEQLDMELSH